MNIYNEPKSLCVFGDELTPKYNYDKEFNSDNYKTLFNKLYTTYKVLHKKDYIKRLNTSTCNTAGLIATCAAIKFKKDYNISKDELSIHVYCPQKKGSVLFDRKDEIKMWNYILRNADYLHLKQNSDPNIKNNELEIYNRLVEKSDIVMGLIPSKEKHMYIIPQEGLNTKIYTCLMYGMNKAIEYKKDIRIVSIDELVYHNISKSGFASMNRRKKRKKDITA